MTQTPEKTGTILIVDGNEDEASLLTSSLKDKGYTVEICSTGQEGLERVFQITPDCIVCDVDLPVIDGYKLCARIREIPRLENVPFIFISSHEKNAQHTIKGLKVGADDFVNRPVMPDEILLRVDVILKRLQILRTLTITDEVTGLFNRRYFDQRLEEEIERLKRYNRPIAVWVLDIDNFKIVNDTYGHTTGDTVLQETGKNLLKTLRRSDVLARFGGDEFAIIMPEHSGEGMEPTGERLRKSIEDLTVPCGDANISVTISIGGIWISKDSSRSVNDVIRSADSQLYRAKQNGRNRVELSEK